MDSDRLKMNTLGDFRHLEKSLDTQTGINQKSHFNGSGDIYLMFFNAAPIIVNRFFMANDD